MDRSFIIFVLIAAILTAISGIVESKTCWDKIWHNNSYPFNGSEYETLSNAELAQICPNGVVIDARCADDRLEDFSSNKTDKVNKYNASCSVVHGLECHPIEINKTCPDMAIQYGCECPTTSGSASTSSMKSNIATNAAIPTATTQSLQRSTGAGQGQMKLIGVSTTPTNKHPSATGSISPSGASTNSNQKQTGGGLDSGSGKEHYSTCIMIDVASLLNIMLQYSIVM